MKVFVVLATHAREALLERTLSSLSLCRLPTEYEAAFVVENGRRGGTEEVVRNASPQLRITYLFEPVGNKSRALNAAMSHIETGLVIFLDDDVRVAPDLLELYVEAAHRSGPGHFLGGPVAPDYEAPPHPWVVRFLPPSARGWQWDDANRPVTKPLFLGFNWAAFASDIHQLGGFSEQFGPGSPTGSVGQESQMQRRLLARGLTGTYVPNALVHHWVPPHRCSPAFALERIYKDGIRSGLLRYEDLGIGIAGYPIVLVKRTVESWLQWQFHRLMSNRATAFAADAAYRHRRGILEGVMLSRRSRAAGIDTRVLGEQNDQAD